jgi:hypothetical protein
MGRLFTKEELKEIAFACYYEGLDACRINRWPSPTLIRANFEQFFLDEIEPQLPKRGVLTWVAH